MGSKLVATAMLTWLFAADSVHGLPKPEGTVGEILEQSATQPSTAFKTQYPPKNQRLEIAPDQPVSCFVLNWLRRAKILTAYKDLSYCVGQPGSFIAASFSAVRSPVV